LLVGSQGGGYRRAERDEVLLSESATHRADEQIAALLRRSAEGDRAAFRRLYDLQAGRLYAIALRITRQSALAADAMHEAFVSVWQYADRFDPSRGTGEAWLTSIVRYRALDLVRRGVREVTGLDIPEQEDEDPDPLARLLDSAEGAALHRCLEELDAERRTLILHAFMDGLTHTELADRFAMPLGTVKSSIRRGLAGLRHCLEPESAT
jgi:RNA polymerase sigma-70 factor (ECF subfamily)